MLLTLLGGRFISKLVPDMPEGVDVTNSAWAPFFFSSWSPTWRKGSMGQLCLGPTFFQVCLRHDGWETKGSMLLTLLGVRLFFHVGLLHDGRGRCY
jgi:hypothetical protein